MSDATQKKKRKRAKPLKECPACGILNHARRARCTDCGHHFVVKASKDEIIDWKSLEPGTPIKVIGGGPYYVCTKDSDHHKEGDRIPLGERGEFTVVSVMQNGLHVHGKTGHAFLYMLDEERVGITGTIYKKYRIIRSKLRSSKS